jgi:hypothetical protein
MMKSTIVGRSRMRWGKSIFALITAASAATWAATMIRKAWGLDSLRAALGRPAA